MPEDQPSPQPPPLDPQWAPPVALPETPPEPVRRGVARRVALLSILFLGGTATGAAAAAGIVTARQTASVSAPQSASSPNGDGSSQGRTATAAPTLPAGGSTSAIAARVDPAVVDITVTLAYQGGQAAGTGIVLTSSGEVLTNNHVIEGAASISVQIDGAGRTYSATVLGVDVTDDIALLKIQGVSGWKTASIGDSSRVSVGQTVVAIGNALGAGGTPAAAEGSVTALGQTITAGDSPANAETLNGMIQVDAQIVPGDSGGPLVDMSGNVIGIDTAAQVSGRFQQTATTAGFAIPINTAMSTVRQIESGVASATVQIGQRAILGVETQAGSSAGALVVGIASGSPAESAGIVAGDTITSVDGSSIASAAALRSALQGHHPGDHVSVGWVDQGGQHHTATVQLIAGPPV